MTARVIGKKHYCCMTLAVLALTSAAWAVSPDIVISQVYGGGGNSGGLYKNDFIELFNRGSSSVDITGWSVQYASATGTSWAKTDLTGTIPAGGYYLIQEAQGADANQPALPTPDAIGTLAMSGTNGKIALVTNTTLLTGSCPLVSVYDFVGYGTANCYEGTAAAPALTNSTADFRAQNGCQDTDQNSADFATAAPAPRNSGTTPAPCAGPPTGACCYNNTCTVVVQASCAGTWLGAGTNCSGNPCGFATGRCCLASGACVVVIQQDCTTQGGTYGGDGTNCDCPNPCISDSNILTARAGGNGKYVRLANVIVSSMTDLISSGTTKNFHVQDGTAGITILGPNADVDALGFVEGDQVTIEGLTTTYNGLFELGTPFTCVVNSGFVGVPAAQVVTSAAFVEGQPAGETYESELVTVRCATFSGGGGTFGVNNYPATDALGTFIVRVSTSALDLNGTTIPTSPQDITGIFSQFDPNDPRDGGYQLLVRSLADIVPADPNCVPTGACCVGATCTVLTSVQCAAQSGTYQGDGTTCSPNPCVGACCVGATCTLQLEADCLTLTGTFRGYGTTCTPNPCVGACCVAGVCTDAQLAADCATANGDYLGDGTYCSANICPLPVQGGDIALGLSTGDRFTTADLIRAGAWVATWTSQTYLQSMEFDNTLGTLHCATGNLLSLNYGSAGGGTTPNCSDPNQGGRLYNLATNGRNASEKLFDMGDPARTILLGECSRLGGLSVSPNNQYIAMYGTDTLKLYVLAYSAGATPGTGAGATVTNGWAHIPSAVLGAGTMGTTWYDNDTVLLYTVRGTTGFTDLTRVDFNGSTFSEAGTLGIDLGMIPGTSNFSDVEYNPSVSPYVFCMFSTFASSVTTNKLTAVDPSSWSIVKQIDLSDPNTLNTAREIALGADGYLYISQYHSGGAPFIDRLDATNPAGWTDNSSVNYYTGGLASSFNGIDYAFEHVESQGACCVVSVCTVMTEADCTTAQGIFRGVGTTCTPNPCYCRGDTNCDQQITYADINPFVRAITSESLWKTTFVDSIPPAGCTYLGVCDINGSGGVDYGDINPFVVALGSPGACP